MRIRRAAVAQFFCRCNLLTCLFSRAAGGLIVLGYHRIRPDDPDFSSPFDDFVFGPTASQFAAQLRWLKAHAELLSETDLLDCIKSRSTHPKPSVLLTFDDAYRDNYSIALPILKDLDIPAIFFVSTHQILSRELGAWDIIAYLIKKTSKQYLRVDGHSFSLRDGRKTAIRFFQTRVKTLGYTHTNALLSALQEGCDVALPDSATQDRELMSWDEIIEVSKANVAIGSHTHTHRPLAQLHGASQNQEMSKSKLLLEKKTGRRVLSIAYPFGGHEHFTMETQDIARQCGYEFGFSYGTGINRWTTVSTHNIRRVAAPADLCSLMVRVVLRGVFWLRRP